MLCTELLWSDSRIRGVTDSQVIATQGLNEQQNFPKWETFCIPCHWLQRLCGASGNPDLLSAVPQVVTANQSFTTLEKLSPQTASHLLWKLTELFSNCMKSKHTTLFSNSLLIHSRESQVSITLIIKQIITDLTITIIIITHTYTNGVYTVQGILSALNKLTLNHHNH